MGGMLARAFAASPDFSVQIVNRNPYKAEQIQLEVPTIAVALSIQELVADCDVVIICTKPEDGKTILSDIGPMLRGNQILATTISAVPIDWIESLTSAFVVKVIPSITQTIRQGIVLLSYGSAGNNQRQDDVESLFARVGTPFVVTESQIRVCSDLTSCGPAFLSFLCGRWAEAAAGTGELSYGEAEFLISQMLLGLAGLLQEGMTLSEVLGRVAIKGGVTETGLTALNKPAHDMFERLHQATARHKNPSKIAKFTSA